MCEVKKSEQKASANVQVIKDVAQLVIDVIAPCIAQAKKDGKFKVSDLAAFLASPDFEKELLSVIAELKDIPDEITHLSVTDIISLSLYFVGLLRRL